MAEQVNGEQLGNIADGVVAPFVQEGDSVDNLRVQRLSSARKLKDVLWEKREDKEFIANLVVRTGLVRGLVRVLEEEIPSPDSGDADALVELKAACSRVLSGLMTDNYGVRQHLTVVLDVGGLSALVSCLSIPSAAATDADKLGELKADCARALMYMISGNDDHRSVRDEVLREGTAVPAWVLCLKDKTASERAREACADAISKAVDNHEAYAGKEAEKIRKMLVDAGAVEALASPLWEDDDLKGTRLSFLTSLPSACADALEKLTRDSVENRITVAATGVIEPVVSVLRDPSSWAHKGFGSNEAPCARLLANLCTYNAENQVAVVRAGGIDALVAVLGAYVIKPAWNPGPKAAALCLTHISSTDQLRALVLRTKAEEIALRIVADKELNSTYGWWEFVPVVKKLLSELRRSAVVRTLRTLFGTAQPKYVPKDLGEEILDHPWAFRLGASHFEAPDNSRIPDIGRGSYGGVYSARLRGGKVPYSYTGEWEKVAAKTIGDLRRVDENTPFVELTRLKNMAQRELSALSELTHPNIVRFLGAAFGQVGGDEFGGWIFPIWLICEFVPDGTLHKAIHENEDVLTPSRRLKWLTQIASALDYIHGRKYFHRDVKPENVLLDFAQDAAKLADLGISKMVSNSANKDSGAHTIVGTLNYMAPEIEAGGLYDQLVDCYALGCVTVECLLRRQLAPVHHYRKSNFDSCSDKHPKWTPLVRGLTEESVDLRWSAKRAIDFLIDFEARTAECANGCCSGDDVVGTDRSDDAPVQEGSVPETNVDRNGVPRGKCEEDGCPCSAYIRTDRVRCDNCDHVPLRHQEL